MPKSIIDVEVNDAAFQAYTAKFAKYQEAVKKLPAAWNASEKASDGMKENFSDMAALLLAMNESFKKQTVHQRASAMTMKGMVRDSAAIAKNLGGATLNLLKWVGIGGLLGGGAGIFGLAQLAGVAGNQRRTALGLGINPAQQNAFNVGFNRIGDTNAILNNVADAKSDYSKQWAFGAMGVNPTGKDPATLAVEMMEKAKDIFDRSGKSKQEVDNNGLGMFFSMADLRVLAATTKEELRSRKGVYGSLVGKLGRSDETGKKWQDFSDQLKSAGYQVQNLFVDKLGKTIVPALSRLSESAIKTLATFVNNGSFEDGIKRVGKGIEEFAKYVGTPEFQTKVKMFADDIVTIAGKVHSALVRLGWATDAPLPPGPNGVIPGRPVSPAMAGAHGAKGLVGMVANYWSGHGGPGGKGWGENASAALAGQLVQESYGGNPFAHVNEPQFMHPNTKYGTYGLYQWRGKRQKDYEKMFGHKMEDVTDYNQAKNEQMIFANWELTQGSYKKVGDQLKAAKSKAEASKILTEQYIIPAKPGSWAMANEVYNRQRTATEIKVTANNNTGGNASLNVAQVAK